MKTKLFVFYFILIINCGFAELNLDLNTNLGTTNNLTNNYRNINDTYFAPEVRISNYTDHFGFYYQGNTTQLMDSTKYNRYKQVLGLNYYKNLTENINLYSGSKIQWRKNQSQYSYYDYLDSRLFLNLKIYFSQRTYLRTGFVSNYKNFFEEKAWRHVEYNLWSMINTSLPTRTTLRAYLSYKNRNFLKYKDDTGARAEINTLWLLKGKFRIAQSISRNIGIYTEFSYQYNPSSDNPDKLNFSSFSPIDDYFGYQNWNWETNLKIRFSNNFTTALKFEYYHRKYLNRTVYDYNKSTQQWVQDSTGAYVILEPHRLDEGYSINLSGEYNFQEIFGLSADLLLEPYLFYRKNSSNDIYFEYNEFGLGLNIAYLMNL